MSGLYFLTDREFTLQSSNSSLKGLTPAQNGQSPQLYDLVHRIAGITVVFFYSISCPICKGLFNDFKFLPQKVNGVNFAVANVSANQMRLQKMSEASFTPIRYVPYIVFYVNGKFYLEYRGPKNIESIAKASYEIANKATGGSREFSQGKVCTSSNGTQGYCMDGYNEDEEERCYTVDEMMSGKVCDAKTGKCYTYAEAFGGT